MKTWLSSIEQAEKSENKNFCKKLLISNKEGNHTFAFIYGIHNNQPFVITFAKNDLEILKRVMAYSSFMDSPGDNYYRAVKERFEKNILCISSVNDQKSCGTIALKMMKYLTYENIKKY